MTEEYYTILTRIGQAKIANALALGRTVQFKYMALGDGGGESYEPDVNQTELRHEVYRAQVSSVAIADATINKICLTILVPADVGGFMIREAGHYDADGDLLAITKTPADPKPAIETGAAKDMQYNIEFVVTNTSAIELKVDPTVIIATKTELRAVAQRVDVLETGLLVFAGRDDPPADVDRYLWMQVLDSREVTVDTASVVLQTSPPTGQGYHVVVDGKAEHIDNAVENQEQAKEDDVIIIEV